MNLEHFRNKLTAQRQHLEKEIQYYLQVDPYRENLRTTEIQDDAITEIEGHDRLSATSEELKKDLQDVDRALERFEQGVYGVCVSCGNKIEEERLEAIPTALMCLACQKKTKSG